MKDTLDTIGRGTLGTFAAGGGFYVSLLPQVEAWLRIVALVFGIGASAAAIVSIIIKHRRRR